MTYPDVVLTVLSLGYVALLLPCRHSKILCENGIRKVESLSVLS